MRPASLLKWAGLALVVIVAAAVAFLLSVDVGSYRDEIEAEFRKATGRGLAIEGDIDLSISLSPAIVVERVAIANAGWGSRPVMAAIERAEAEVELLPLLAGDIRVTRLILVEPDILLERNADGLSNWRAGPSSGGRSAASARSAEADGEGKADGGPPPVPVFSHVEVRRGRLTYRDARSGEEMRLDLGRVSARAEDFEAPLEIEARGAWNGHPFSVSGSVDSLGELASGQPVRLEFEGEALGFGARLAGEVVEPGKPDGLDLRLAVRGADLSSLGPLAGPDLPKLGPVAFDARVEGGAETLRIERIQATVADNDVWGRIEVALAGPRPRLAGSLASSWIELAGPEPQPAGGKPSAAAAGGGAAPETAGPERVFPDDPLPLDGLGAVDLDLTLKVASLAGAPVSVEAVEARVGLDNGVLAVKPLRATVAGSPVEGELHIDTRRGAPGLRLAARAAALDLGRLLAEAGVTGLFEGNARASADLSGSGASMAELMAGLDGDIRIVAGNGRLKTQAFDAAVGGANALLGTLFEGRKEWTVVNCAVASVGIGKGRAAIRAALIDTEYSTVAVKGAASLASETLDLTVEPRAKSATLNVAVPVHVRGSFADPEFRPDTGAALKKLGGLAAIALFPPAAIVGLGELGGDENECLKDAAAGPGAAPQPAPASPEKAVRQLRDNLKGAVKDIGRGLKGLFRRNGD